MSNQRMIPGAGFLPDAGTNQRMIPGYTFTTAPSGGGGGTTFTFTVSGGFSTSGTISPIKERVYSASGTVSFSGTAPFTASNTFIFTSSGGVVFSGTVQLVKIRSLSVGGQVLLGGAASYSFIPFGAPTTRAVTSIGLKLNQRDNL